MMKPEVFFISEDDKNFFLNVLTDFYRFVMGRAETEAKDLADTGYHNLIRGLDLEGNSLNNENLIYLDDILSIQTEKYYFPTETNRHRYKKNEKKNSKKKPGKGKKTDSPPGTTQALSDEDNDKVDKIKEILLYEYPSLKRGDLKEDVGTYCRLKVEINKLLSQNVAASSMAIKNLVATQISLGNSLGIDEGAKAKQKESEDRQSVAALSLEFQKTLDDFPEIRKRLKYKEVRVLLEKVERQEISKILFSLPEYAGLTIDEARIFIKENESEYEAG